MLLLGKCYFYGFIMLRIFRSSNLRYKKYKNTRINDVKYSSNKNQNQHTKRMVGLPKSRKITLVCYR